MYVQFSGFSLCLWDFKLLPLWCEIDKKKAHIEIISIISVFKSICESTCS